MSQLVLPSPNSRLLYFSQKPHHFYKFFCNFFPAIFFHFHHPSPTQHSKLCHETLERETQWQILFHHHHQLPRGRCFCHFLLLSLWESAYQLDRGTPLVLCVLPPSPQMPPPLVSVVTVPPQRPLLCGCGPPPVRQMEWQASHSHRAIFSQTSCL